MQWPIGLYQCYPRGWALSRLHESRHVQLSVFYWINQCALQHVGLPSLSADNICRQCWFIWPICSQSHQVWWTSFGYSTSQLHNGMCVETWSAPQIESNSLQRLNLEHLVANFLVPRIMVHDWRRITATIINDEFLKVYTRQLQFWMSGSKPSPRTTSQYIVRTQHAQKGIV